MPLELEHLRNSIEALSDLAAASENTERMERLNEVERNGIRSGVIQNFEVTYELSWKLMQRWLNINLGSAATDGLTRRQLFRIAAENRLIPDAELWMNHHLARNATSHTYGRESAERVYRAALEFAHDARRLLAALEARND